MDRRDALLGCWSGTCFASVRNMHMLRWKVDGRPRKLRAERGGHMDGGVQREGGEAGAVDGTLRAVQRQSVDASARLRPVRRLWLGD